MEKEIELIFDKLKEAFDWTSETVTQLYPMVLQEYQVYNVLNILGGVFVGITLLGAIVVGSLAFAIVTDDLEVDKYKKPILISGIFTFVSLILTVTFHILQIYLAPHYHMFTQLM